MKKENIINIIILIAVISVCIAFVVVIKDFVNNPEKYFTTHMNEKTTEEVVITEVTEETMPDWAQHTNHILSSKRITKCVDTREAVEYYLNSKIHYDVNNDTSFYATLKSDINGIATFKHGNQEFSLAHIDEIPEADFYQCWIDNNILTGIILGYYKD